MYCYNCGCLLSEHDYCTACGADVGLYKKIMYASNRFYDDGLDKAEVRDLSGAVISLRQSLKFNKNNIEARNCLGLVYFEMGETVAAMAEWVISKNLRPEKNVADDYIGILEENAGRMSVIYETIEGYNKAYEYCLQDAKDLAIIQLKSVLSKNTKFVKAHQLLALLYLDAEDYQKAERELDKTLAIDKNNTLSLKYLKIVEDATEIEEAAKQTKSWRKNNDSVRVMHDNEMIIQPANVKEPKSGGGFSTFINIGIGMLIGLAVMYFLVVPGRMTAVRNQANDNIAQIGEEIDSKNVEIQSLEADIRRLEDENATLRGELEGYVGDD